MKKVGGVARLRPERWIIDEMVWRFCPPFVR
jgi:hypothetical protein